MFVKLMGADGKSCGVHEVAACIFHERTDEAGWWATMTATNGDVSQVMLEGSAYLMNEHGVTFDKFSLPL